MERQKTKKPRGHILALGIGGVLGIPLGLVIVHFSEQMPEGMSFAALLLWILWFCLSILIQLILHEAGHLVCGLMSGYRFLSFRIANFMWIRENGKIRVRRFSVPGTTGQCLMLPPETEGPLPYALYNAGGVVMNLITALLALIAAFFTPPTGSLVLIIFALSGFILGLSNGIPLKTATVANDGANILIMKKSLQAQEAFRRQLLILGDISRGTRIKDMPDKWFEGSADDPISTSIILMAAQRKMDAGDILSAEAMLRQLLEQPTALLGLHRNLAAAELLYCELVNRCRPEELERLHTPELIQFMKANKTALHTRYAWELLAEHDEAEAQSILTQFEKIAARHPYPCEIEGERELLARVREKANS